MVGCFYGARFYSLALFLLCSFLFSAALLLNVVFVYVPGCPTPSSPPSAADEPKTSGPIGPVSHVVVVVCLTHCFSRKELLLWSPRQTLNSHKGTSATAAHLPGKRQSFLFARDQEGPSEGNSMFPCPDYVTNDCVVWSTPSYF